MTESPTSGNPPAASGTELELLASLQIFGLPVEATATFGPGIDTILAARFGDATLGDVLTYLVSKAEPGLDFKLTPPWDLLNTINLHDFVFEVDLTNFRVGFRYDNLDFSFPLVSLDRIEVWYSPATKTKNKSVDLSLFGSFLGVDFSSEPGLTWDVLSQPAPAVPGQGPKVFDLEYLGLGQHVTLRDPASLATLALVIDALEGSYANVDPHSNPLATLTALKFDASSGWLFGAKFSALETVTLSAVFNDPVLYGLRLALDGQRAGKLAGLEFEILYRKVSDSLGVFHIELKLPDAMRKIEAGEANITLPIIDLDIYTNGDFLVDLGFPYNLDFSRAFQIDMIVWVGPIPIPVSAAAGLYFGVLSGQTASQVPQVSNGSFAPVIVAGFGVRVGLGYAVSIGPLDAGFFAGFLGILEGVLAWFHPDSDPGARSVYFKVTGTVGIQIHIWGTVDFVILQASLDVYAYATATVVIESYQPIQVGFEAGISVSVSIRVLFFSITLSFSATISESFTIGQAAPTPWVIGAAPSAPSQSAVAPQFATRGIVRSSGGVVQASPVFAHVLATGISWHDQPAPAAQSGLTLGVYLQPMITAGLPGDYPGGNLGSQPQPQLVATLLVADRGQLEGALAVANADLPLTAGLTLTGPDGTTLTKPDGTPVTTQPGDTFGKLAGTSPAAPDVFTLGFLTRTVPGLLPKGTAIALPDETVTLDGGGYTVPTDTETLSSIAAQLLSPFEQLTREALLWAVESARLSVQQAQAALGGPATGPATPGPDTPVSASHLHALYVDLTNPDTPFPLSQVVNFFTSRGITVDLRPMPTTGTGPDNPSFTMFPMLPFLQLTADGTTVDFGTGPYQATPAYQQYLTRYFQELAAPGAAPGGAAPGAAVSDGQPESLAALLFTDCFVFILRQLVQDALDLYRAYPYQAQSTDILADIANRFGITDPDLVELNRDAPGLLAAGQTITFATGDTVTTQPGDTFGDLLDRSRHSTTELAAAIGVQSGLLQPRAVLTLTGGGTYAVADGDTLLAIATTRQSAVTDTVAVARIAEANKTSQTFFASGAQLAINQQNTRVVGGDTLRKLAARLQLTPLLVALAIRRDTGVLTVGSTIQVAGGSYVVGHGDTLASIAAGLTAPLDVVAGAAAAVPGLLIPLTTLTLTGRSYVVGPFDTLASIAAATGAALTDVATAVADQLFAGVGFPLPTLPYTVAASSSDPATSESLDAIADRFGTTLAAVVAGGNADLLALRTGAPVTFGLTTQIRPDDSLTIVAKRFHVDIADVAVALSDQVGLLTSGATIVVNSAAQDPQASYVIKRGDTLASIAAAFGTSAEAIIAANPQVSCQPGKPCWSPIPGASLPKPGMGISMPVGLRINLPPGSSYQAGGQDTLAGIAERFSLSVADLVPAVADATLTPQATVVLPPISYQVADGDTPLSIAAWFGLTVQQLVLANTDVGFDTVVVPDAEVVPLGTLVGDLAQGGSFDKPSGSLARFLLHGLRLPSPTDAVAADPADQRLYPLYTLTGQQFTPPTPAPDNYALTLAANAIAPQHLLTFAGATGPLTVPLSSGDRTALANIAGQLATNPPIDLGVLAATRYPPYAVVPRQYALGKPVPWQAATQPPLRYDPAGTGAAASQPPGGQPTLLPFPDALRHQIAASADAAGPGLWVGLASGSKANPAAPTQTTPIDGFGWATKIDFGLRRAPDPNAPDQPLPNIYQVFGVDQDAIADLQQLLDYALGTSDTLTLTLAYPLSTTAALRSDPVDPAGVLLVKANLSTQPKPPVAASAELLALATPLDAAPVTVAATMSSADARDFLTLLWEATVTNTGGYYLYYQVGQDGPGLPAEIFNQDPTATVSLLITAFPAVGSGSGSGSSTIPLRAFHNTALVTDNLADPNAAVSAVPQQLPLSTDPATLPGLGISVSSLVAANVTTANLLKPGQQITAGGASYTVQPGDDIVAVALALGQQVGVVVQQIAADQDYLKDYFNPEAKVEIYPEWLTAQGTLRPGAAGFRLVRTDPDPADPQTPRPAVGTPQDPEPQDPKTQLEVLFNLVGYQLLANGGFRASADGRPAGPARSTSGPLNYELTAVGGVEPRIYEKQLRIDRFATNQPAAALDGQQDPYAGVGTQARFGWQPQDVFGNRLLVPQGIDVDVGYTDDLVALSQWPSVVTGYQFAGPAGAATVQVSIALDTSAYVATPGEVFVPVVAPGAASLPTGVAAQATAHRDRYAEIFWQLSHDVTAEVTTTVDGTVDGPASHPVDVAGLAAFTSGAWGYLATVAATTQLTATTAAGDTLASIAATYQVSPAELAEVNRSAAQSFAATELLTPSATVTVDQRYTVIQGDTLAGIAQRSPASASAADLAAGNPALALQPGITLASGYQARAGDTLASVAAASGVTAADIGTANAQVAGLLAPEQPVLLGHVSYLVQPGDTFSSIAAVTGATVADLATANGTAAGLLAARQVIAIPRHVVLAAGTGTHQVAVGDTLASIAGPALEVTALGSANSDVTGLLATGVQLSFTTPDGHGSTTTQPNDTLSTVALRLQGSFATQQVTVALLAEQNQNVPCLARGATLLVPPADVTLGVPVTASNPAVVFALETAVTLTRTAHVDPALAAVGASDVSSVTTPLAPALPEGAAGQTLALQSFAVTFEEAFTTPQLKLATTGSGSSGTRTQQLFAVQYDTPALNYTILGGTPYFFAPPPLSTALWSSPGPIPIRSYTRGQPLGPAQPTSFTGVDLDGWAQTFLAQLDLVLSSDYAVAAYSIDPARYIALIQAKKDLASAIQDSVDIVVQPGPDPQGPGPDLAAAKDALYQRLLVTLSIAYQVDTIVQLPVTVTAPADWTGDTAPRLLGQPAAAPFIVGTGAEDTLSTDTLSTDTLSTVATHFQAPLELLVTALANDGYLLAAGFNVPIQAGYTVAPGDTLASVATHFTMSVAALGDALADQTGLLQPGAAVNLVRRTYPLAADDTLFSAISYLALDVATADALASAVDNFAAMNATLPNLFVAGTTLQMPLPPAAAAAGPTVPPYQVQPGDTLTTIAAAVGRGATPSWIVTTQLHIAQVLQAGTSVAYLSRVAGFSLSDANISLVNGQHNSLTFLFHTASSTALSNLTVQLSYQVNQLEYGIEDVSWASGYQSSQWLTFLRPPTDAAIGMVDVPIPLRAYPVPPSVIGQQIVPFIAAFIAGQDAGPPTLQQLRRYNYDYTFSTQRAAQDTVSTSQLQNTVLADGTTASTPQNGLPAALAQYTAIRDGLEQDLALLTRVNPRQPVTVRTADTDTLTTLAQAAIVDVGYFGGVNAEAAGLLQSGTQLAVGGLPPYTVAATDTLGGIADRLHVDLDQVVAAAAGAPLTAGVELVQPRPDNEPAWQALRVFTALAGQVAGGWQSWVAAEAGASTAPGPPPSAAVGAVPQYAPRYQVRLGTLATGETTVHLLPDGDAGAVHADDLVVGLSGYVPVDGSGQAARQQVVFTPRALPAGTPAQTPSEADEFNLLVPDRDVVTTQNIWGEVSITRNANLLAGLQTNPAFVYMMPEVKAATPGVPLISWTDPLDLAGVPFDPPAAESDGARPLVDWLINFFDALLNRYAVLDTDTLTKIAMRYDLTLAGLAPAVASVPGLLIVGAQLPLPNGSSHQVASGDTLTSVAAANSAQVADLVQTAADVTPLLAPGVLIRPAAVSRNLRVAVDYSFPLATVGAAATGQATQSEIVSRLPVLLCPMFLFNSATDLQPGAGFCASLAQQLAAWAAARGLPPGVGRWVLDVSLYTTLPGAAQAPPVLELTDVRLDRHLVAPDSGGSP